MPSTVRQGSLRSWGPARTRAAGLFIVLSWCLRQRDQSSADHPAFPSHPAPKALAWGCPAVQKGASRGPVDLQQWGGASLLGNRHLIAKPEHHHHPQGYSTPSIRQHLLLIRARPGLLLGRDIP